MIRNYNKYLAHDDRMYQGISHECELTRTSLQYN